MQIQIKISHDGGPEEWVLLELQGDLESRTHEQLADNFIGDLHYTKQGAPVLIIGHHILYGKVLSLDPPFAVLRKSSSSGPIADHNSKSQTSYALHALIKKKLLFKTRPKPIVCNVAKVA